MKSDQCKKVGQQDTEKDIEIEETPASPDTIRSSSPDCQILPVIIPTERSTERRRQFRKIPVITLTDRTREITISSPSDSNPDVSFTEWDMQEETERHTVTKNRGDRQSSQVASGHDVATAAKLIGNNLPQKVNDGRSYGLDSQDIPTVPVPSLGGSRRLTSVLEKNKLNLDMITDNNSSRAESPVNVPEVRLKSPDPEILFAKPPITSPRPKDNYNTSSKLSSKPSSIPLLFSPPPLSNEPPLSMEDLAELLNDEDDNDKRSDKVTNDNVTKQRKDSDKQEVAKNGKVSKSPLLSDRENEKRSEEVDKHATKITPRKCLSNVAGASSVKSSESKGSSHQLNDHRLQTSFSNSKFQEPRYADNYERHPRQRDSHGHESAKDKLVAGSHIPEETSPQISILYHNIANKSDERNVPLYQRRSNLPPEGRKDTAPSRPESEFIIEGIDYYNMHVNQMHWQPTPITTNDHAFGNAQWTSPSYGGIAQSSLQSTQHPYQHPMESQFRPNQFPTGPTLSTGPRPLITPTARSQDMNHVTARPENIRENIPPLMSSPTFPVASQYRGFQMGQGSYDPGFTVDRSTEYPHVRPNWEVPANRTGENVIPCGLQVTENSTGTSYPRPSTPYPWGTRDRCNIGRGRDGYYEKNRTEVRPGFNRRPDWPRDGFPNRDPRVRTEHNTTSLNQTKETGGSARDPRLAKDKHVNTSTKAKDAAQNEKDPRKRPTIIKMTKEKTKSQKSGQEKEKIDKLPKDRMQSPLESLYGVIDTKANQNSGLQKFKIPKIKRSDPPQPSRSNKTKETENISCSLSRTKSDNKKRNKNSRFENTSKDDASAEVSSSSDTSHITVQSKQNNAAKEGEISSLVEEINKNEVKIGEADSVTSNSKINDVEKSKKNESEADDSKSKEEVTQEWIEALIRKSFESGEGKKLFEQAKLIQKLGEALEAKKLKKIKKIIESESESSSDKDEAKVEAKKTSTKKKRRVIVSDSSDDECLAERLGLLTTSFDASDEKTVSVSTTDLKNLEKKNETTVSDNINKELVKDITVNKNSLSENRDKKRDIQVDDNNKSKHARMKKKNNKENDQLKDSTKKTDLQSENNKQINSRLEDDDKAKKQGEDKVNKSIEKPIESIEKSKEKNNMGRSLDQDKDQTECSKLISDIADDRTDEISNDKPKVKTKRRNSLEMLQEDIREMFISEGVVTATGHRMCRLLKEDQSAAGITSGTLMNSKKDEGSCTTEKSRGVAESSIEAVMNNKSKKALRSRNIGESNKSKVKNKKDIKRTRNLRSKESILSSDSEEDQPLALRTEKLSSTGNKTPNQEEDCSEETNDSLRRSKRFLRKDVVKEPRVIVEKTDFAKIDSSKVMFDSSSDESFGIDVSKLAAAVDVSLRPEQSDQDSEDTMTSLRPQQIGKNMNKRNSKSRKASLLNDNEDGISFTDEESALSDISMSCSTIAGKRTSGGAARTSTREELLSNILVGLVPASTTEKNTLLTDKGNEADLDEDTNERSTETNVKKTSTKKKKKKSSWQMGIVSTKKKKKKNASSKTAQINIETNTENNVLIMNTEENNRSISEGNKTIDDRQMIDKPAEHNDIVNDTNADSLLKCDIKPPVDTSNFDVDYNELNLALSESLDAIKEALLNESLISIEETKPEIKMEAEEASTTQAIITSPNANTNTLCKETSKIVYNEQMEELFCRIEIKQLMDYIWTGQDKYKCLLCIFTDKNIVHHYKMNHPGREVLIARLSPTNAETAILESSATVASPIETTNQVCKFHCRFCYYVTEGAADVALEAFYEHCTTHTGEYRFQCNSCSYQAVAKASMRTHYKMCCKHNDTFNESATEDEVPREGVIYGYLCRGCNYVQLKRHNVEAHVMFWHRDTKNIEILKINMSASVENVASSSGEMSREPTSASAEESFAIETKPKILEFEDVGHKDVLENIVREISQNNNDNIEGYILHESKTEEAVDIKEEEAVEKSGVSQEEPEVPVSTGNLSVFVCPPELENKEDEIQRERQKRMQEIAHNIGILKNYSKPGLSIIDKLQDKMRTDAVASPVPECDSSVADVPETRENSSLLLTNSIVESVNSESNIIIKKDVLSQPNSQEDPSSSTEEQPVTDKPEMTNDKTDGIKIRDPLAIMDPCKKGDESDGEISDNERSAPIFESDSSSEQSDSELPTDVNMILKETSSMNASSSRDPMLTTIQRLAAQLQNVKPLDPVPEPILDIKVEIKSEPMSSIPNPPDVVPIAIAKRLLTRESNNKHLSKMETPMPRSDASPPKNFIRFRRLSGDMLSMPVQSSNNQEDTRASSAGE